MSAFAWAVVSLAGCSDGKGGENGPAVTKLALADPAQAELAFEAVSPEPQVVVLDTDAASVSVEQVLAEGGQKAEWCVVSLQSATQIKVAPADNRTEAARTARYRISAGGMVPPVEFTVTQAFAEPEEATLSIDLPDNYGSYSFTASADGGKVPVTTVTTNMSRWTAELDPGFGDEPYCSLQTASGKSGEKLVVEFKPNKQGMMQSGASVKISAGNAEPIVVYLNQDVPLASSATVYDANWEKKLTSPHPVSFGKEVSGASAKQEFGVDANGGCSVKVVVEGGSSEAADSWLESYYGTGSWTIYPSSANTTGSERKLDVVLLGAQGKELFRIKVTQAGA